MVEEFGDTLAFYEDDACLAGNGDEQLDAVPFVCKETETVYGHECNLKEERFMFKFKQQLATKRFFSESDRKIVEDNVMGYMVNRLLLDAVNDRELRAVSKYLDRLRNQNLIRSLDHAINTKTQDTLLHVATRLQFPEIVEALLEAKADPDARNRWGDKPTQRYMIPLLTAAARKCRESSKAKARALMSKSINKQDGDLSDESASVDSFDSSVDESGSSASP